MTVFTGNTLLLISLLSLGSACTKERATEANAAKLPSSTASSPVMTGAPTETGGDSIAVGKPPPDFTVHAQDGSAVHLASLKGQPVVVYFYPKDETPGCTKEACAFRDAWNDLHSKGVVLIGISTDTDDSHKAFAAHHKLPFLLVSDPNGDIAGKFGVPFAGPGKLFLSRQSFVIGKDGNVTAIYRSVDVTSHAAQIRHDVGL